jgi:hypothetical protein
MTLGDTDNRGQVLRLPLFRRIAVSHRIGGYESFRSEAVRPTSRRTSSFHHHWRTLIRASSARSIAIEPVSFLPETHPLSPRSTAELNITRRKCCYFRPQCSHCVRSAKSTRSRRRDIEHRGGKAPDFASTDVLSARSDQLPCPAARSRDVGPPSYRMSGILS